MPTEVSTDLSQQLVTAVFKGACILAVLLALLLIAPTAAGASAAPAATSVYTITGAELASQLVAGVSGIEIGSRGATVTCEPEGAPPVQFPVDYSAVVQNPVTGGAGSFLLIGLGLGVAVRFLGLLLRLAR